MPSKDFIVTTRDKNGREVKSRTSIVNFDNEDPKAAQAEWERLNPGHNVVSFEFAGDTSQQTLRDITNLAPPGPVPPAVQT
jgi:hypothetical protein